MLVPARGVGRAYLWQARPLAAKPPLPCNLSRLAAQACIV